MDPAREASFQQSINDISHISGPKNSPSVTSSDTPISSTSSSTSMILSYPFSTQKQLGRSDHSGLSQDSTYYSDYATVSPTQSFVSRRRYIDLAKAIPSRNEPKQITKKTIKVFTCVYCEVSFSRRDHLLRHLRKHERPPERAIKVFERLVAKPKEQSVVKFGEHLDSSKEQGRRGADIDPKLNLDLSCESSDKLYKSNDIRSASKPFRPSLTTRITTDTDVRRPEMLPQHVPLDALDDLHKNDMTNSQSGVRPIGKRSLWTTSAIISHEGHEPELSAPSRLHLTNLELGEIGPILRSDPLKCQHSGSKKTFRLSAKQPEFTGFHNINKSVENPNTDGENLIGDSTQSHTHQDDGSISSRLTTALSGSPGYLVNAVESDINSHNRPNGRGLDLAKVQYIEQSLSAGLHINGEPEDGCISNSCVKQTMEATSAREEVNKDDDDGKSSDEQVCSLSPKGTSPSSDSGSGYESMSEKSLLSDSKKDLISQLMDEVCSSFLFQTYHDSRQHGQRGADVSSSNSNQNSSDITYFESKYSSASQGKRARRDDEDSRDGDDGKRQRKRSKVSASSNTSLAGVRYFACPFHKFDASIYSNRNENQQLALKFRSCGPPGWPTIGKMKEHLYRGHQTPIHCPRCWTVMKTEAALGEHARASTQCNILTQPLRWIPREVRAKLKARMKPLVSQTDEDTWRYIFGLIFPDTTIIPSPYYDEELLLEDKAKNGSPTTRAITTYEEYARAHLPRLVEEALETSIAEQTQPIEESLRRALAGIVRDCHTRLAQIYLQHRSSGNTGISIEALPSFYIEPLNLVDQSNSLDLHHDTTHEQHALIFHPDSGYGSSQDHAHQRNSYELFGDQSWLNELDYLRGANDDNGDVDVGYQTTLEDCDWAVMPGNSNDQFEDL